MKKKIKILVVFGFLKGAAMKDNNQQELPSMKCIPFVSRLNLNSFW